MADVQPRTDHAVEPFHCGLLPFLAWHPGCAQTAYEIQAARDRALLIPGSGARWRSGIIAQSRAPPNFPVLEMVTTIVGCGSFVVLMLFHGCCQRMIL